MQERTGGRIHIIVESEAKLGSESEVLEQIKYGGIVFARVSLSQIAEQAPEMNVLQLPYLVQYITEHQDGENAEMICEQLYDLAKLQHAPLSADAMTKFVARSNDIMMLLTK